MTFQVSDAEQEHGPDGLDGTTLVGLVMKSTYTPPKTVATASTIASHEASGTTRLAASCTVDRIDGTGELVVFADDVVFGSDASESISGIAWCRPGATDADKAYMGFSPMPQSAGAVEPSYPGGLYSISREDFSGYTVAGNAFVTGDVDAESLANSLRTFLTDATRFASVGTIVYDPSTPSEANSYQTWEEVAEVAATVHGQLTIHVGHDATVPAGTYDLPQWTKFSGNGTDWFLTGGATLTLEDGVVFTGPVLLTVEGGLALVANNTVEPVWTVSDTTAFLLASGGGTIANDGTKAILKGTGGSGQMIGVESGLGGRLLNGADDEGKDLGSYELVDAAGAGVVVVSMSNGIGHATDDLVRGTCTTFVNLIGSPAAADVPTHANLTVGGYTVDLVKPRAANVKVEATAANVSPVAATVEAWLVALDAAISGGGGGGSVATDAIWTAKGDLAVGTGTGAAVKVGVGSNGEVIVADSAQTSGLKWSSLAASDVGAAPTSRVITAGTGLTGGGNLTADRTLAVSYGTTSGTSAEGDDSRITGAAQKASNLSDLASTATALANLGGVPTARTLAGLDLSADRSASALRTAFGLVIGTDVQAYDSDLAAIAALSTTSFGRSLLEQASAAAARSTLGASAMDTNWHITNSFMSFRPSEASPGTFGGSVAPVAGALAATKVVVRQDCTISGAKMYVRTQGASGARVNAGLYALSGGKPDGAPLLSTGEVDVTTTGYKNPTFTGVAIGAGSYALVWWTNDTTVRMQLVDTSTPGNTWPLGLDTDTLSGPTGLGYASSYASPMPTLTASNFTLQSATSYSPLWCPWKVS